MRIGWFTPYNPDTSIGSFNEAMVRQLARREDVTVFACGGPEAGEPRPSPWPVVPVPALPDENFFDHLQEFELLVYTMGGSVPGQQTMAHMARRHPGIVVLHDLNPAVFPCDLRGCLGIIVTSEETRRRVAEAEYAPLLKIEWPPSGSTASPFDATGYCDQFQTFAEAILRQQPILRLADLVSERLLEFGAQPADGLADRIAAAMAELTEPYDVGRASWPVLRLNHER